MIGSLIMLLYSEEYVRTDARAVVNGEFLEIEDGSGQHDRFPRFASILSKNDQKVNKILS